MRQPFSLALGLYGALAALALAWSWLQGRSVWLVESELQLISHSALSHAASLGTGCLIALFTVGATPALLKRMEWASELKSLVRGWLGPASQLEIAVLAVSSGVAEELFFRGAMLPAVGWLASSLVFGLLHIGPSMKLLPWTGWAIAMGFIFGGLFLAFGNLTGPIFAHVAINWLNLRSMLRSAAPAETNVRNQGTKIDLLATEQRYSTTSTSEGASSDEGADLGG